MRKILIFSSLLMVGLMAGGAVLASGQAVEAAVTKWPLGRKAAVSLTFDDGTANQFLVAAPILDRFGLPATFHIITGEVAGSKYKGTFVGRQVAEIAKEAAVWKTDATNFFERASAVGYAGLADGTSYHERAGELYEDGKADEAYRLIDDAYAEIRRGAVAPKGAGPQRPSREWTLTWEALRALAERGCEISSHTVTHARLAVLDDANLARELEKSREDILDHLGLKHTFTIECPYGTEDERAVRVALRLYPASRNRLPEPFLEEINRWGKADPAASAKEYVQWQRGVLTATPMEQMKGWVETAAGRDNIWLVLVFHGVDGVGWEPKTGAELREYFGFIAAKRKDVWVATFQDAVKYMRERMKADIRAAWDGPLLRIELRHPLDPKVYDLPLTVKIAVPGDWTAVEMKQGDRVSRSNTLEGGARSRRAMIEVAPNAGPAYLAKRKD